jgi:hypothetical protein
MVWFVLGRVSRYMYCPEFCGTCRFCREMAGRGNGNDGMHKRERHKGLWIIKPGSLKRRERRRK